jgi:hypothetical protein
MGEVCTRLHVELFVALWAGGWGLFLVQEGSNSMAFGISGRWGKRKAS